MKSIWRFPNSLKGRYIVGIDLSNNNIRFVFLRPSQGKNEVAQLLVRNLGNVSIEEAVTLIKSSLSESGFRQGEVFCILPAQQVITKNIEIPSINPKEIQEIISLQAGRHTPYSREEIIVDYIDIGRYRHSYTKVLLIIVSRQLVKRQWQVLEKAGLRLKGVFFAPEGIAWAVSHLLGQDTQTHPVAVLHIDEVMTDFVVVFQGRAIFVRNIPVGAQHLVEERQLAKDKFFDEIKKSLESYQSEDIEAYPAEILVVGATELMGSLVIQLKEALRLPVRLVSYQQNVSFSKEAISKLGVAKQVSIFGLIACLLGRQQLKVSLIPEELRLQYEVEKRARQLIKTGILIFTNFIFIFLLLVSKFYFDYEYLKKIDRAYQPLHRQAKGLEEDFSRLNLLRQYLSRRGLSLEVLAELYNLVGDDLMLSDIRFDEQAKFVVRGTARAMSEVFSFTEAMGRSKFFKDVKTKYTTKRKDGLTEVTDFEINAVLKDSRGG